MGGKLHGQERFSGYVDEREVWDCKVELYRFRFQCLRSGAGSEIRSQLDGRVLKLLLFKFHGCIMVQCVQGLISVWRSTVAGLAFNVWMGFLIKELCLRSQCSALSSFGTGLIAKGLVLRINIVVVYDF